MSKVLMLVFIIFLWILALCAFSYFYFDGCEIPFFRYFNSIECAWINEGPRL